MKFNLLSLIFVFVTMHAYSQAKIPVVTPVNKNRLIKPVMISSGISYDPVIIKNEIDSLLNKIVEKHISMPNSKDTWVSIKNESTGILLRYFRSGQLYGSKPEESFFVVMDASTMTENDLINHKMILVAGIAVSKPAEFFTIRVEKKNVAL